ncbi:MAG: hypothetical protein ACJ786_10815, partial [Catenulispora sp.]
MTSTKTVDRTAGWLGVAFLIVLLVSEVVLSLPDEHATAPAVAAFYSAHRGFIIALQVTGFAAAALLGWFAWRLRAIDRRITAAGIVLAAATLVPALITTAIALVADPRHAAIAGDYNQLEPRGDDVLFAGVVLFAVAVLVARGRSPRWLGVVATITAVSCLLRLLLEAAGRSRGFLEAFAPVTFLLL